MKKLVFILGIIAFLTGIKAQSCLPEGITFSSQDQIDNFQSNYPNCTEIEGNMIINGEDINNLNGLEMINTVGGELFIGYYGWAGNPELTDLSGLENLHIIQGSLHMINNISLNNLSGLDGLIEIGGHLYISNNTITNFEGINNLMTIGGSLVIDDNYYLSSLSGLSSLNSIGNDLKITSNPVLSSLEGLNNINPSSITSLEIKHNSSLSNCSIGSICNYLMTPNGPITIINNNSGCDSPPEIATSCGLTLPCLPFGNYYFSTQSDIDHLHSNYSDCSILYGDVSIMGDNIHNLNGFNGITAIGHDLDIKYNPQLNNLSGLEEISSIGGTLQIYSNTSLSSISSLNNLNAVDYDLYIGYNESLMDLNGLNNLQSIGKSIWIVHNDLLQSISALQSLDSIGQFLTIAGNSVLPSLEGLDHLKATSILGLEIHDNDSLYCCHVKSICDYLADPIGAHKVYDNDYGCSSTSQVLNRCITNIKEPDPTKTALHIFPNPTQQKLNIKSTKKGLISILSLSGLIVYHQEINTSNTVIDISSLAKGIYLVQFNDERKVEFKKIIKL